MEQLLIHLFGDYFLQTDKQALNKKKSSLQCFLHCLTYSLPFLLIASFQSVLVIGITHFLIDRWDIVPYIIYLKNGNKKQVEKRIWLTIIIDNTFHLIINYFAIKYL